jgi:hypothetical protein
MKTNEQDPKQIFTEEYKPTEDPKLNLTTKEKEKPFTEKKKQKV